MKTIIVKTVFNGKHRWEEAPDEVAFLREFHDHIFYVNCEIEVGGANRELEFFMVKREIDAYIRNVFVDMGELEWSCEHIATFIWKFLKDKYGEDRWIKIEVFEDNFNGGTVRG